MNENSIYSIRKSPGSTPDLSLSTFDNSANENREGMFPCLIKYLKPADSLKNVYGKATRLLVVL